MGGLLCARRLLQKYNLDGKFEGTAEVTGEYEDSYVHGNDEDGPAAFHALLDGGLKIPHSEKKFFGYDADEKEYDAAAHRERILGGHVSSYMETLEEEQPEEYAAKFSRFIKAGVTADGMEDLYLSVHKAIRADPKAKITKKKKPADLTKEKLEGGIRFTDKNGKEHFINRRKRSLAQRNNRVNQIKQHTLNSLATGDDEDSDE